MEEKKKIELNCALCAKIGACDHTEASGVCPEFCPDTEAISNAVNEKTNGMTWDEAEKAAKELGKCIRRKAWPKESFAWWRKDKVVTSNTNDPYIREVCRRTGFEKIPEREGFALVKYDSKYKGIPEIHWWWVPTMSTRDANDWEVFDAPQTYEDREIKFNDLRDPEAVGKLMGAIFGKDRDDEERIRRLARELCGEGASGVFKARGSGRFDVLRRFIDICDRRLNHRHGFGRIVMATNDDVDKIMKDLDELL